MLAEAGDGEEAQQLIEKHKPDVAVEVTDSEAPLTTCLACNTIIV